MLDLVKLQLIAGDGGNGRVSFRRAKYEPKGGPDGGNGGDGGNILIRGNRHHNTLRRFSGRKVFEAEEGQEGGRQKQRGAKGEDVVLEVPLGTTVWVLGENQASHRRLMRMQEREGSDRYLPKFEKYYLEREGQHVPPRQNDAVEPLNADNPPPTTLKNIRVSELEKEELFTVREHGETILACQGGIGGRGNDAFKSSRNTTPLEAEYGTHGEQKLVLLELKLLADVGMVGLPSVGKSTFLSRVTNASPRVAAYPFTTLEPYLGRLELERVDGDVVLADLPGLIEGASRGEGLGYQFLRHIENCEVLLYMLSLPLEYMNASLDEKIEVIVEQYRTVRGELKEYDPALLEKKSFVCLNKIDIYDDEFVQRVITDLPAAESDDPALEGGVTPVSMATGEGLDALKSRLAERLW